MVSARLLVRWQPRLHGEIGRWIEGDEVDGASIRLSAHDALRRYEGDVGKNPQSLRELGVQFLIGRLDGQKRARYIHESASGHDHDIGAHARKGCHDAAVESPASDETRERDADCQHHREAQQ